MKIEKGMIFKFGKNGHKIEILKVMDNHVKYKRLDLNREYIVWRLDFESHNPIEIKANERTEENEN